MSCCSPNETGVLFLNDLLRMLWEQHAAWTRMAIISIAEGLADEEAVTARLLRNPTDLAAVFLPLYGEEVAVQFRDLLSEHLTLAAQLVKESKAGETEAAAATERRWYANADAIAALLASINPCWPLDEMTRMWHQHLDQVKAQAVARLQKNYPADIAIYDQGEQLLLQMADQFTEGIICQFPCFVEAI